MVPCDLLPGLDIRKAVRAAIRLLHCSCCNTVGCLGLFWIELED